MLTCVDYHACEQHSAHNGYVDRNISAANPFDGRCSNPPGWILPINSQDRYIRQNVEDSIRGFLTGRITRQP